MHRLRREESLRRRRHPFPSPGKRYRDLYVCVRARDGWVVWPLFGIALGTHSARGTSKDGRIVISRSFTNPPYDLRNYHRHAHASTTIARSRINIRLRPKPRILSHSSPLFHPPVTPLSPLSLIGERQSALVTQSSFLTLSPPLPFSFFEENPSGRFLLFARANRIRLRRWSLSSSPGFRERGTIIKSRRNQLFETKQLKFALTRNVIGGLWIFLEFVQKHQVRKTRYFCWASEYQITYFLNILIYYEFKFSMVTKYLSVIIKNTAHILFNDIIII